MKNKKYLILLAAFALLLAGAVAAYSFLSKEYTPGSGQTKSASDTQDTAEEESTIPAPDFTVQDRSGETVSLSDYFGKPIVINFWATWCGPCKSELPAFDALSKEYGEDVHFLMVNLTDGQRETIEIVEEFLEENGYEFPVYFDTEYMASYTYGAYSIPLSVFIDKEGNVVNSHVGAMSEETLRGYIDSIL
ncbi:MAG: TlpA family protein disulfide reductase [Ruminococcus sp.]|nr:TlpA family protein disulfide reductase [Ruminococcus sp.]